MHQEFEAQDISSKEKIKSSWLLGRKKWLALLASGLVFGVSWKMTRDENENDSHKSAKIQKRESVEDDETKERKKEIFKTRLVELQKIDDELKLLAQNQNFAELEEPPKNEPNPYEDLYRAVGENEEFNDYELQQNPDGVFMIAPKNDILSFQGVDVRLEEDGTFTVGTACGLDLPVNVEKGDLTEVLKKKLELSQLFRQEISEEKDEAKGEVEMAMLQKAQAANFPLNETLVQNFLSGDKNEEGE